MINYSINIVTFNRAHDLKKAVREVVRQADNTSEIIIIDNSTSGMTKAHVSRLNDSRIRYVKSPVNRISVARNIGIKSSRGKYIVWVDDDCIPAANWFKGIKKHSGTAPAVMGGIRISKSTFLGDAISALGFPAGGNLGFEKMWKVDENGFTSHLSFCNCIVDKKLFKKVGMLDETFKYGAEDVDFARRLVNMGYKIKYLPELLVYHKPRDSLKSFAKWHIVRGRSNYYLKKKIKNVSRYVGLRLWSSINILNSYKFKKEILIIPFLLGLSFVMQQYGYFSEKLRHR